MKRVNNDAIYQFMREYYQRYGLLPRYRDIAHHFALSGRDSVHYHIRQLQKKGLLDHNRMFTERGDNDRIQVIGEVAAGEAIESSEVVDEIDVRHIFRADNTFWLRVKGDSMYEMGINDGDYVQIAKTGWQRTLANGDIVVAQVNDEYECTLKAYYENNGRVTLVPRNPDLAPMVYAADAVQVVGKYTGVMIQKQFFRP